MSTSPHDQPPLQRHKLVRQVAPKADGPSVIVLCLACDASTELLGPEINLELAWYQAVHDQAVSSS